MLIKLIPLLYPMSPIEGTSVGAIKATQTKFLRKRERDLDNNSKVFPFCNTRADCQLFQIPFYFFSVILFEFIFPSTCNQ